MEYVQFYLNYLQQYIQLFIRQMPMERTPSAFVFFFWGIAARCFIL